MAVRLRQGQSTRVHVVVMVLGDVGRSPRMQYHAMSLSKTLGAQVALVGYRGERCIPAVENDPNITQHFVDPIVGKRLRGVSFLVFAAVKVVVLVLQLLWLLLWRLRDAPHYILVQNPPSIPALAVAWVAAMLRGSRLVIDWHNLGFSVLALSLGPRHPVVKVARMYESWMARRADKHFCVTKAMQEWLFDNFGVAALVLHDRPPVFFGPTPVEVVHELMLRLEGGERFRDAALRYQDATSDVVAHGETLLTLNATTWRPRERRPALVVSSTSWTADEDFSLLLDAVVELDHRWQQRNEHEAPFVVLAITGKGPLKEMYEARIFDLAMTRVAVITLWLEAEDYPRLMGAADLGICLHKSTSGLDLPMKVVDMFGCEVPVCALGFSCLSELVQHNVNGLVFGTSEELCQHLDDLLAQFLRPTNQETDKDKLLALREGVTGMSRWEENWDAVAAAAFAPTDNKKLSLWFMGLGVTLMGSLVLVGARSAQLLDIKK